MARGGRSTLITDPWTIGAGYSVRPVTAVIKTKHAGLNPMVLGSVRGLYFAPRGLNKPAKVAEPRWSEPQASSYKQQATSLTAGPGCNRINLERNNYD